ncbi:FAD/NAD(P)-binding protein, partial [Massilia sp. YIM B04103]|uniref:FAD/NAD(P)-binding protein n=1 Tax=Massilia sp. YIM B04103 TaxID=2963106 RepID=UPI00210B2659
SQRRVEVLVFDPQEPGPGLHSPGQPDYLMLNTVASQLSIFPDDAALAGQPGRAGPGFYQWCVEYKGRPCRPPRCAGEAAQPAGPADFLPRGWLGEYLVWAYRHILAGLPPNVSVHHIAERVSDIAHGDGIGYILSTPSGMARQADAVVLSMGHSGRRPAVHTAPPLAAPGAGVALEGLGLAAMDALAALTVGVGGSYRRDADGTLRYQPSGREARIVMYSRSGLPFRTRPDIAPGQRRAPPVALTLEAVAELRRQHPLGIDFEAQVLPLLKAEMIAAYYGTAARDEALRARIGAWFRAGRLEKELQVLACRFGPFDPGALLMTELPMAAHGAGYQSWMRAFIEQDLRDSTCGLAASPVKAAAEVWRDCREQLRRVIDDRGLTPASQRLFFQSYAPLVNQLVAGPQKERHEELLALLAAGVLRLARVRRVERRGAGATLWLDEEAQPLAMDYLVAARIPDNRHPEQQPEAVASLRRAQLLQCLDGSGFGVRTDGQGRAIDAQGRSADNLWVLGPLAEGSTYYNHYVPSSGAYSRAFMDAQRIAQAVLAACDREREAGQPAGRSYA